MITRRRILLRWFWLPALLLGLLVLARPTEAAIIHMRYFESFDVHFSDQQYQVFTFAPLQGELVTIVAYGINEEEGVIPSLTVLGVDGVTLSEDFNPMGKPLAYTQFTAPQSGMYTFLVARTSEKTGLVRVMLFKDEPIDHDVTLLDFADPILPSRAYLIAGDSLDPIEVRTEIVPSDDPNLPTPQFFVSRGDTLSVPPEEERFTPVQQYSWVNDNGETFYTINVRLVPEIPPSTAFKSGILSMPAIQQFLNAFNYYVIIGDGSDAVPVDRAGCVNAPDTAHAMFAGPGETFSQVGSVDVGQSVEIVGTDASGNWLQVVDGNQVSGASWIPRDGMVVRQDVCGRAVQVFAPASADQVEEINASINDTISSLAPPDENVLPVPIPEPQPLPVPVPECPDAAVRPCDDIVQNTDPIGSVVDGTINGTIGIVDDTVGSIVDNTVGGNRDDNPVTDIVDPVTNSLVPPVLDDLIPRNR